ncbi:Uncharacterised protein [Citrobacter koseri]|uniref:Uncharacterized protein n=1 Tax=Citrobacter koseri TaxID=545 RepID=A0A2X2V626_CITKO|nr:Uncharacterised protein [Citrobacter koseri]
MKRQYFGLTPLASLVLIALTAKAAWASEQHDHAKMADDSVMIGDRAGRFSAGNRHVAKNASSARSRQRWL